MIEINGREFRTEKQWERVHRHVTEAGRKRGVERTWRSPKGGNDQAVFYPRSATCTWTKTEKKAERKAKDEAARLAELKRVAKESAEKAAREAREEMLEKCAREATGIPWDVPVPVTSPWEEHTPRVWARSGYVLKDSTSNDDYVTVWDVRYDPTAAEQRLPDGPARGRTIALDTETTGLNSYSDEILTLSICDAMTGEEIWDRMYRPARATEWPDAERVNGISPTMVADCPEIADDVPTIRAIVDSADAIVAYNADFDLSFMSTVGAIGDRSDYVVHDVMLDFALIYGEWSEWFGDYKWQKLVVAASYIGYDWGDSAAHSSLADARATAAVWRWMRDGHDRQDDNNSR